MKENHILFITVAIIIAAGILAFTWFKIESNRQTQLEQKIELEQKEKLDKDREIKFNTLMLRQCLDQSTSQYPWENAQKDAERDPANAQRYIDLYTKLKKEAESTCKNRYSN